MTGDRYYKLFNLPKDCTEQDIRKKYKQLAKKMHPDQNKDENAVQQFQELQNAYEYLLSKTNNRSNNINDYSDTRQQERTAENEWILYKKRAYEHYVAKKKKQAEELEKWYQQLNSGWRLKLLYSIASLSIVVFSFLLADDFLPSKQKQILIEKFSNVKYKSMNNHPVSVAVDENNNNYWLDNFNNNHFVSLPTTHLEYTAIFKHPTNLIVQTTSEIQYVPIHFTFYWAQNVLYCLLLIPIATCFYRRNDAWKIMTYYFSVYGVGGFILFFLITESRWLHFITLGNF